MKLWLLVLALLFTLGVNAPARAATALNFSGSVAELAWEKGPQSPEESVLRLTWKNAGGQTTEAPGAFKVVLFMPSMGHGSAPTFVEPARDARRQDHRRILPGRRIIARFMPCQALPQLLKESSLAS